MVFFQEQIKLPFTTLKNKQTRKEKNKTKPKTSMVYLKAFKLCLN